MFTFWQHCAISALQISKKHFATLDFFVKTKLVSTVVHINSTIKTWLPGWTESAVSSDLKN